MKILITGGAGFIGTNYVYFHSEIYPGDEILVLDKLTYAGNLNNILPLIEKSKIRFVQGDITHKNFIDELFGQENFDVVINFAAETHVDRSIDNPDLFFRTNIDGTVNLLDACKKYNVGRFHQVSTDEVYGDVSLDSPIKFVEDSRLAPNSPYSSSKASADLIVLSYFSTYGLPVTISRCSNNYGPYQFPEKVIPYFFKLISEDKQVPLYGDGKHVRDWLFVKDHCAAIDLILKKGKLGEVYNIGAENYLSNLELTYLILNFFEKNNDLIRFVDDRVGHDRKYSIDTRKIIDLGFNIKTKFEEGLQITFDWYKDNEDWVKSLDTKWERKHNTISKTPLSPARI